MYRLQTTEQYILQEPNENQPYWIAEMNLYLGVWQGTRENRAGKWLRWWDEQENFLLWGSELAEQERQRAEQERQRAEQERQCTEQERQRAEQLAAQLRAAGIEPEV